MADKARWREDRMADQSKNGRGRKTQRGAAARQTALVAELGEEGAQAKLAEYKRAPRAPKSLPSRG